MNGSYKTVTFPTKVDVTPRGTPLSPSSGARAFDAFELCSVPQLSHRLLIAARPVPIHHHRAPRGRATVATAPIVVHGSRTNGASKGAQPPSPRPTILPSPSCASTCAPQATGTAANRRADELLTGAAPPTSSRTARVPMARSERARRASSSGCCDRVVIAVLTAAAQPRCM